MKLLRKEMDLGYTDKIFQVIQKKLKSNLCDSRALSVLYLGTQVGTAISVVIDPIL